ncbi:hypothetical protein [Butyrivibrio sp. MC2021]|uniref:hypothetical protein n=1 Tax=Butyrivibrio sp. MC2021 TaxID=1408306 RepID=UPI0004797199|nr:hypothetical protein [Butyrivibrio sp. MC2021]
MDLGEKIIFKGLDYSVSGKKAFVRKILSIPETREIFLKHIMESAVIEQLDLYNKIASFDSKFHSVSLDEDDLVKIFDIAAAGKTEKFLSDSSLSDRDKAYYIGYLTPLLKSECSQSFKIDYYLIYGIVNQEKCHTKLKELWLEHPEYYSFYLTNMKENTVFESNLRAHLIPYSRMLYAMLEIMRIEKSEDIYKSFIELISNGFPHIKKILKRSNGINSDVLRDIVKKELNTASIPFLYKMCIVPISLVLAENMDLPLILDYDMLIMLNSLAGYIDEFICEEQSDSQKNLSITNENTNTHKDFLEKFKSEYGTLSSTTEIYMPNSSFDVTTAPQSDMVRQLMQSYGISPRKLAHYNLTDSEINNLLGLMPTWNKRNYWYALHISSLCKYIAELEKRVTSFIETLSPLEKYSYEKEKESLSLEKKYLNKEKLYIQNSLHDFEEEVTSLNQEITRLREENESMKKQHENAAKDLTALRNYVYLLSKDDSNSAGPKESDIDYDNWLGRKVVVIGGHDNWQSKMKTEFPEWTYLNSENKTFPAAAVKDKDYIICNTEVLSHAAYYKLMSVKGKDQKLLFVRSNNIDLVMEELSMQLNAS